jgi:pimeloyl-ACP methyl ester carboxylesterase
LNEFVDEIERTWECKLETSPKSEKSEPEAFMFHTKETLGAMHQPLMFTAWVHGVSGICAAILKVWGFKRYTASNGCSYWINAPMAQEDDWVFARRDAAAARAGDVDRPILTGCGVDDVDEEVAKPIIFVHGLGVGLAPYLPNIAQLLRSKPGRKIALLSLPHISMRATPKVPEIDAMVDTVAELTMKHKLRAPCLYGHSFGTFVIARTCHRYHVSSVVLLDPVAICLCLPKTVSILYHLGNCWNSFKSYVKNHGTRAMFTTRFWTDGGDVLYYLLRDYFLVREIGVMTALRRKFWWATHNLWADQIPNNSLIVLEAHDMLIDCEAVAKHVLRQSNARVIWQDNFSHGMFISPWGFSLRHEVAKFLDALPTHS